MIVSYQLTSAHADVVAQAYLKSEGEARRQHWYNFISRQIAYEEKLTKTFQTIFRSQGKEALKNINTDYFFDIDLWNEEIEEKLTKALTEVVETEGNVNLREVLGKSYRKQDVDIGFDVDNPYVWEMTTGRAIKLSPEINEETQKVLRNTLRAGYVAGESMPVLAERVKTVFQGFEDYRALRISRSETVTTSNAAAEEAYAQSSIVEKKQWIAAISDKTCDDCILMNGRISELRKSFDTSGIMTDLTYLGGELPHPTLHPSCRCALIAVF